MGIESNKTDNQEVVFLIPVYNTRPEILGSTIMELYSKISGHTSIVIVDDGSSENATQEKLNELRKLEGITIIHLGKNAGKPRALLSGVKYIKENLKNIRCVFILDDDVTIELSNTLKQKNSENIYSIIVEECRNLNEFVPVVTFPARSQSLSSMLEKLQDLEHLLATHVMRLYLNREGLYNEIYLKTRSMNSSEFVEGIWVNGSGSLWLINELHGVLENHSGEHDGDDLEMTLILRKHKRLIKFSDKIILYAKMKSYFSDFVKQRVKWTRGAARLLFTYPNEVTSHFVYLSYIMAPLILYLDIFDLLIRNYINNKLVNNVLNVLGMFMLILITVSYLRTTKFFEELGANELRKSRSLLDKLYNYKKILKQYLRSREMVAFAVVVMLLFRELLLNWLHSIARLEGLHTDIFIYLAFLSYSTYFTYKLLKKYGCRIYHVYGESYRRPLSNVPFVKLITYSAYILFYILAVMPLGYLYSMIKKDFLKSHKIRYFKRPALIPACIAVSVRRVF